METTKRYENYPLWIIFLSNLVSLGIYGSGFLILLKLGWIFPSLYLVFVLILEYRLLRNHCTDCYYWGKTCGFGKGKISSLFFKKGDNSRFCSKNMAWRDMVPDMMVSLVPFIIGAVLLILEFDILMLIALLLLISLSTAGNGFIRGTLTCMNCKQRDLGCPAERLFNKGK